MKRWVWLGGWGLSPQAQVQDLAKFWPEYEHVVIYPGELCIEKLLCAAESADRLGGYSLGAYLLLLNIAALPKKEMLLIAPILDFKAEAALGGRVPKTKLAILLRWLRRDPVAALNDFYLQAGLTVGPVEALPYKAEDLIWGIEQLQGPPVDYWRYENVRACVGERDPLLDAAMMQQLWPELTILPDVGHDLGALLMEAVA